jgi:hypothetical protein
MFFVVEAEAFYNAKLTTPLWIAPSFANHDTGNVVFTLTDFGVFGYYNLLQGTNVGSGFRFPPQGTNALYHGSLIAGISENKVSDGIFGGDFQQYRYDFEPAEGGDMTVFPGIQSDQEGFAVYRDTRAPSSEQVGLEIVQKSYAWSQPPNDDFVIVSFSVKNISGQSLSNLFVGLYMDWDPIYYNENEADWNEEKSLGYVYNQQLLAPNTRYYGTSLLSHMPASYRVIDSSVPYPPTEAMKYQFMSSGFVQTSSQGPMDQATLLSAGPFTLLFEDSVEVVFSVLGGEDLDDLEVNADAAAEIWDEIVTGIGGDNRQSDLSFQINSVYPRPANGAINFTFTVPGPGKVEFDILDPLGRSFPVWESDYQQAGSYDVFIPHWKGASGIYFLRGRTIYGSSVIKLLWLK